MFVFPPNSQVEKSFLRDLMGACLPLLGNISRFTNLTDRETTDSLSADSVFKICTKAGSSDAHL